MAIFTSQFYDEDHKIKIIKGIVEKDIRSSYFGGNVGVYKNVMLNGYEYDMNSQYSKAMLEDMPIGDPIFTTERDLDKIFGFVYGKITTPSEEVLSISYIQFREGDGSVSTPRGCFYRWIYSEEIKEAIKDGYKIDVICAYKFHRGDNVFKNFVDNFYQMKSESTNPIDRLIAKLMLNSLYGKFGMKDINSRLRIINKNKANEIIKNYNFNILSDLGNNKVLIRYTNKLNDNLRKIMKENDLLTKDDFGIKKVIGIPSSVQIASAIASNARISINIFKNMPDNYCYYSDTDSCFLEHSLDDKYVGNGIGKMKIVNEISKGIFINKKLYAIKDNKSNVIIKASGADSKRLKWSDFEELNKGNNIKTKRVSFEVNWKKLNITIVDNEITLKGKVKD